ncbi:hypothetical protein NYP18_09015 [Corynebacterium sp. YIM 101645]|uniref:Uncharacterized protein n=1 Tax=Corynebacterium lemuris TaxID=1859292 RepID=A0ABT2FXQ3_9CORY|nr:hypothetical protein [Corynebacterium lemuris]MCS5479799.1 hypothetical protein [Corynebacterium lemuris]
MSNSNDETITKNQLREFIKDWREGLAKFPGENYAGEILDDLEHDFLTPTMADIEWIDAQHAGLCAHASGSDEVVRMIYLAEDAEDSGMILCMAGDGVLFWTPRANLTPLTGTQLDLRPAYGPKEKDESTRQQMSSWCTIARHPFFAGCYEQSGSLLDAMIAKLDDLMSTSEGES